MSGKIPAFMDRQPRLGPREGFRLPRPECTRLLNGSSLLLHERHDLPLVQLQIELPAGTVVDPPGSPGAAYLTALMLTEGAGRRSALQLSGALQDRGIALQTWAHQDMTGISMLLLRRHLEAGLELLADMVLRPRMGRRDFTRVRALLRSQALQRRVQPERVARRALRRAVFGLHPYGRTLLPLPGELSALSRDALVAFHRSFIRPASAVVAAAGDLSLAELGAGLEQVLGSWRGAPPAPPSPAPIPGSGPRLILVDRPGASQSVLEVGQLGPGQRADEVAGIRVLDVVLGGSFTSRLNRCLREERGYTYGAHSRFFQLREAGLLAIWTSVDTGHTVDALLAILDEVEALRQRPVGMRELSKARELVAEEVVGRAESVGALSDTLAEAALYGHEPDHLDRMLDEAEELTPRALQDLAGRLMDPGRMTLVVVGDARELAGPLERALGPAARWDLDGRPVSTARSSGKRPSPAGRNPKGAIAGERKRLMSR